jgi:pectate disaccharide-lyase
MMNLEQTTRQTTNMKQTLLTLLTGLLLLSGAQAAVQTLPFTDHFAYTAGNLYTVGAGVWDASGSTGPELTVATAATLTAPVGFAAASGNGIKWTPSGTARRSIMQFTAATGGTLYASFLVNLASPPSSGTKLVAYFDSSTSQPTSPQLGFFIGSGLVGIAKKGSTPAATVSVANGTTHLVVVRYTFTGTSSDQVDLWVDPASSTYGASNAPVASGSTSGGNNVASIPYFGIYAISGSGPSIYLDEVRIATNWAGVTPAASVSPAAVPVVTNAWMTADGLVMRGTNGSAGVEYGVMTTPSLPQPMSQWTLLAKYYFDANGNFDCTNPLPTGSPQKFYRLQIGNLPPLYVAPVITNQPPNRTVAEGQNTSFSVGASGTAPLSYQWYFNTNTLLAGKTSATLSLSTVATNQSGGYFVIVTNVAGAATSSVATLTVTSAPPVGPTITTQPQNQSVTEGGNATFTVVATGTPPLSYQWFFNTNTALTDATNTTLTWSGVTTNDAGVYSVMVTNNYGAQTSSVATLTVYPVSATSTNYVATNGNDSNPGTLAEPFATIPRAISSAVPGTVISVRDGTYYYASTIRIEHSGMSNLPIRLEAYPGEHPVINFTNQPYGAANRGILITTNGNWWEFKGLEICYAGDNGVKVEGSHHRFEQCVFHHNGDTGIQIGFGHTDTNPDGQLAAYITVINCDSYYNYDPDSSGGDADGFAAKMHCGRGIVFMGCRSWYNSDDGWDLFETDYSIVISNCWAWKSAYAYQGNGNGIKMGGNGTGGDSKGTHYAYNCITFGCKANGFTQNSHKDGEVVVNCLAFSNGSSAYNYFFEGSLNSGKVNAFTNNAGIPRSGTSGNFSEDNSPIQVNNSWNLSVTVNSADFADLTEAAAGAPRQADGSLPTGFAHLVAGSDLIDKGVDAGKPFNGAAPDLGAFEYSP